MTQNNMPLWVFFVILLYFLTQIAPGIYWKDAGDLSTASYFLSTAHPTGYPVYVMLCKFMSYLPFGSIIYRINVFSAVFSALTLYVLYPFLHYLIKSRWASYVALGFFIFSFQFWYESSSAEIYILNILFIVLLLRSVTAQSIRAVYLFYFILGISLSNHLTPVLWFPLFCIMKPRLIRQSMKSWCLSLILLGIGISIYLFLPIRAVENPFPNFGDTRTWHQFMEHVTASQYKQGMFAQSLTVILMERIPFLVWLLKFQWTGYLLWVGIIGWFYGLKNRNPVWWISLIGWLALGAFLLYEMGPNFFTPGYLLFSILSGCGLMWIYYLLDPLRLTKYFVVGILIASIFFISILEHVSYCNKHLDWKPYRYGTAILTQVSTGGIVFTETDSAGFILWYLLKVERRRPDVIHVHRPALTWGPHYWEQIGMTYILDSMSVDEIDHMATKGVERILDRYIDSRAIVWEPVPDKEDPYYQQMVPEGLFYTLRPRSGEMNNLDSMDKYTMIWSKLESIPDFYEWLQYSPFAQEAFGSASNYAGYLFLSRNELEYSMAAYERSIKINPDDKSAMNMLARIYSLKYRTTSDPAKRTEYQKNAIMMQQKAARIIPRKYPVFM